MKSNWKQTTLGEVADINVSSISRDFIFDEILYLDTGSVTKGKIDQLQGMRMKNAPSRARRLVQHNDIVYSTVRPTQEHYALLNYPEKNLVASTGFAVITVRENADPQFVYFLLTQKSVTDLMQQMAEHSTSTYPSIKPEHLAGLKFLLPPLPEQKSIAAVLSSLDDKIELLRDQNKTLEEMTQRLFKEWFMGKDLEVRRLGDLTEVKRGGSPRPINDYISTKGLRWLKISDASATPSPFIFEIKEHIKEEGIKKTVLLKAGSLVLSNSATPGVPKILAVDSCIHDGWLYFPKSKLSNEFLYLLFQQIRPQLIQQGSGSVFTNLKTDILKNFDVPFSDNQTFE